MACFNQDLQLLCVHSNYLMQKGAINISSFLKHVTGKQQHKKPKAWV